MRCRHTHVRSSFNFVNLTLGLYRIDCVNIVNKTEFIKPHRIQRVSVRKKNVSIDMVPLSCTLIVRHGCQACVMRL